MSDFKDLRVGDRVVLNSGGPPMTVENLLPGGEKVECVWFQPIPMLSGAGDEVSAYGEPHRINLPAGAITKKAV